MDVRNLTNTLNDCNVKHIREQIAKKRGYIPFLATNKDSVGAITDFDTFPYPRFFRGQALSSQPTVLEREAGWRIRNDCCYNPQVNSVSVGNPIPSIVFQMPNSTIVPPGATCNIGFR